MSVQPIQAVSRVKLQREHARRALLAGIGAALWAWAAVELWHSSVPGGLVLPHIDAKHYFSASFLQRSSSYERFLDVDGVLATVTLVAVLAVYARRGHTLMRESAAGPIGTGILLGMLGFAVVWLAEIPFDLAAVWWERHNHVSHQGYLTAVLDGFLGLSSQFLFVALALAIAMGLAIKLPRWWWALAAPTLVALALLSSYLSIYLIPNTHPLTNPALLADTRALAQREGVPGTKVVVQNVARYTTAPNAESVGFGSTRRVILWDTLLDGRFSAREIQVVIGHELGHLAHQHPLKRVGWLALFLIPVAGLIALITRRRGGLGRPEAIPLALLAFVVMQLMAQPLKNVVSRREEAEADWSALRATRDPLAARALFQGLTTTSHAAPDPPTWSYVLFYDHPTSVQRIAMVEAWRARNPG